MSNAAYRARRCSHGLLAGLCVAIGCEHYDGAGTTERSQQRSKRVRLTARCTRCDREVPRGRLDMETRRCIGGCKEVISDERAVVP